MVICKAATKGVVSTHSHIYIYTFVSDKLDAWTQVQIMIHVYIYMTLLELLAHHQKQLKF